MSGGEVPWSADEIGILRSRLLDFFDGGQRELPWRDDADPYGVLVAEVMSQQTRVETVVPYYRRWMARFPDPAALAAADREEVLSLWQGLGYYSRARNLHRAARELEGRYGGKVPSDPQELRSLPGVGPYTAGAVASIAFGAAEPAVDGNVRRVLARLMDDPDPSVATLGGWVRELLDPERPGDFNQALMELGALVCTPRRPRCEGCPVADFCGALAAGTVENRPAPRKRRDPPHRTEGVAVAVTGEGLEARFLLRRRPEEGLLGGMWEFPGSRSDGESPDETARRTLREALAAPLPTGDGVGRALPAVEHAFSHLKVTYRPFLYRLKATEAFTPREQARAAPGPGAGGPARWASRGELGALPLPVAQRRILRLAEERLGEG